MQIAVADQVQFEGAGTPRSIVLDGAALERAATLGRNVAEQIGRPFDAVEYRGDDAGLCPMCHLDVVVLRGRDVECATCGASGALVVEGDDVAMYLRVNGEQRQASHTGKMSVTIPEIISHYSPMGYSPGDIISTGTVSGVAGFSDDPASLYLKPGDEVECEIENVGILRNRVIASSDVPVAVGS